MENRKHRIRVLTVDDHPIIRDGLAMAIRSQEDMELVGEGKDGLESVRLFRELRPDVTLMDLQMPEMNGIDAIAMIRKEFPSAKIVVLTTYSGDIQAARALKAGASGYLLKSTMGVDLVNTIRRVHGGLRSIQKEVASEIAEHISEDSLTRRELETLRLVAEGHPNKKIADILKISEETVKGHMKNILAKLAATDRTHAVRIGTKRGFWDPGL